MNKTWTFIGGMLAGVASVFAAVAVAVELEGREVLTKMLRRRKECWLCWGGTGELAA